jgi:hypothetical protein
MWDQPRAAPLPSASPIFGLPRVMPAPAASMPEAHHPDFQRRGNVGRGR